MSRRARGIWTSLWDVNERTKAYLRLDGGRIAEDTNASEEERELARRVFATGVPGVTVTTDAIPTTNRRSTSAATTAFERGSGSSSGRCRSR